LLHIFSKKYNNGVVNHKPPTLLTTAILAVGDGQHTIVR